jgi:hypothetical protein
MRGSQKRRVWACSINPDPYPYQGKGSKGKRGEAPLQKLFPLSKNLQGDKGGEVDEQPLGSMYDSF